MKVYLAGPDVFLPDAGAVGAAKKDICARLGLTGLFPLDGGEPPGGAAAPASLRIFRSCTAMMDDADAVIAHLTPFRGASADAGTVYELGYMAARGKLCTGYTNRRGDYAGRIAATRDAAGALLAADGLAVEDAGLADNLMIVHALDAFGLPVLTPVREPDDIWRDLTLFTQCAAWLAAQDRGMRHPPR